MAKFSSFDVIVIGSGAAGFSAVEAAQAQGASVCLIEQDRLGGECPNYACVPSKALLKTAAVYRTLQHAREFGIQPGTVKFDFTQIMKYRHSAIESITGDGAFGERYIKILHTLGVETKKGSARFVDKDLVEVDGEHVRAKAFVIATGTSEVIPSIPGLDRVKYVTWKNALQLTRQPKSMAIIGGGPVGCELATFFATFGTRVVLIQRAPFVLHREDVDISRRARTALEQLKIEVITSANTSEIINGGSGVFGVQVDVEGERTMHAVEQLVIAVGKKANIAKLGLTEAGIKTDDRGWIVTNKEQQTNVAHIFAAGDVDGGLQFTHTAHHEGVVAGYNAALLAKKKRLPARKSQQQVVPRATFIAPEVASVGLTQSEAVQAYHRVLVGRAELTSLGRAVTDRIDSGFLKILAHPKTRKVIGGHMIGERSGEVIHEIALAIYLGTTIDKLASMIHAYPTFSEIVVVAASQVTVES